MGNQLQMGYLDPLHLGFRPGHGVEIALIALVHDFYWDLDEGMQPF